MARAFDTRRGGSPEAATAQIAGTLFSLGMDLSNEAIAKEDNRQLSQFNIGLLAESDLRDDFMVDNANDPESYLKYVDEHSGRIREQLFKGITQPGAREAAAVEFDEEMAKWKSSMASGARKQLGMNAVTDFNLGTDAFMAGRAYRDADPKGKFAQVQADGLMHFATIPNATDDEMLAAQREWTRFNVSQFLLQNGTEEQVNNPNQFVAEQGLDLPSVTDQEQVVFSPEETVELQKARQQQVATQEANRAKALEAEQEKEQQVILDKFLAKDFTDINQFINAQTALDTKDKIWWIEKAGNWAEDVNKGTEPETNALAEAELQQKALSISTGGVTKAEFYKEAIDARYGKTATLDDAAFEDVTGIANREHKTYQANAMKEAIAYGETQLLSKGQIEIIAAAQVTADEDFNAVLQRLGRQRKLEEENFSEYNRAMSQWFEAETKAGRDPNDDDIYKESRKKMAHYRSLLQGSVAQQASALTPDQKAGIAKAQREGLKKFQASIPHPLTIEDAAKLKPGTQFVDPDGVLRTR